MSYEEEIELMNKSLEGDSATTTALPSTTAPVTAAPEDNDQLLTDAPSTDSPATASPSTDSPATSAPVTAAPEPEVHEPTIAELMAEIETLKAEKQTKSVPATAAPASVEPLNFVTEEEFEEAQTDPAKLNALLSKVYERATADLKKEIETRFSSLPETVSEQIKTQEELTRIRNDFYSANADLEPFQKVVGIVFQELQTASPDKSYKEILAQTAPEVRKRLNLPAESRPPQDKKSTPPKLPNRKSKPGTPSDSKPSNDVASQIAEMNKSLGV